MSNPTPLLLALLCFGLALANINRAELSSKQTSQAEDQWAKAAHANPADLPDQYEERDERDELDESDWSFNEDQDESGDGSPALISLSVSERTAKQNERERKLVESFQLGISVSLIGFKPEPDSEQLALRDSKRVETILLAREDKSDKLAKSHDDDQLFEKFEFKTLAPSVFHHLRALYGIDTKDYLASIADRSRPLIRMDNAGASSSRFYLSHDSKFLIKTMIRSELEFLVKILAQYYANLKENHKQTLLPKIYGQHCYSGKDHKELCFIIINNLMPTSVEIHQKYDLKGSKLNRRASDKERAKALPNYRDLDFMEQHEHGFTLEAKLYNRLMDSIERDLKFLASMKIMDYSLLVGVHNLGLSQDVSSRFEAIKGFDCRAIPATNERGEKLILFIGIIDMLQQFKLIRRLENVYKSMFHDNELVTIQEPTFYGQRMRQFLATRVFRPSDECTCPIEKATDQVATAGDLVSPETDELEDDKALTNCSFLCKLYPNRKIFRL